MPKPLLPRNRSTVLMYHAIRDNGDRHAVSPASFAAQMAFLAESGRSVISIPELAHRLAAREPLEGAVALTFDDGYRDAFTAAFPILRQHRFPATVFVITDRIGTTDARGREYLSIPDLQAMRDSGLITIAPHSRSHPHLPSLSEEQRRMEVEGSREALAAIMGESSPFFAYPYGDYDARTRASVAALGFGFAFTTRPGTVKQGSDTMLLPRNGIGADTDLHGFQRALSRRADLDGLHDMRRRFLRRLTERTLRRAAWWADRNRQRAIARALLPLLERGRIGPALLSDGELARLREEKRRARAARLSAGKQLSGAKREDLVSIGVFACNRFDLLQETCASLARYLERYGSNFTHEVLFFHDGPNPEIEAWARTNSLFDKVFINSENKGLSANLNRFWFEESRGKYLMNVEDDWRCEFQDDFVSHGREILDTDENVGCVRFERKYPGDYRKWDEAYKIRMRVLSARVFHTPSGHSYRILEEQSGGKGVYANACSLLRFSALTLTGRLRSDKERRREQEREYMYAFNALWEGARGIEQKDSPFLHIGYGKSVATWSR